MSHVACLIVAVDELFDAHAGAALAHEAGTLAELARLGCEVWLVGTIPIAEEPALRPWVADGRVRRADDLEQAARRCRGEGKAVMVVGSRPSGSVRFANRLRFASTLVTGPDPEGAEQPAGVEELPDFVVASLSDVLPLLRRLEREDADFEGTE